MSSNINPKARQNDLVVQELSGEVLIYDLRTHKALCLNQTVALVWQHADGETSIEQLINLLQRKLKVPVDESIVWFALEQLEKANLLENKIVSPHIFAEMNRRDLIKSLGKSAAVALPVVMMIVAPPAVSAASGFADGQACANGAQCNGGGCVNSICCSVAGRPCGQCCPNLNCDNTNTCRSIRVGG
jgi:hypothetical protein